MAKSGSPRLPWTAYHIRSTGELGTDRHWVWNVAPWSVLTLLDRLVRFCRSEKKMSPFLSSANSVSPPPWGQVSGFPRPTLPGIIWKLLPWSRDVQMKLCAVDEPLGTLEYHRSARSMAMSGSKPERCWSTTTSCENRRPEAGAAALVGAGVAASAPTTIAPAASTPAQARASRAVGRGTVPPHECGSSQDPTTGTSGGNAPDPSQKGQKMLTRRYRPCGDAGQRRASDPRAAARRRRTTPAGAPARRRTQPARRRHPIARRAWWRRTTAQSRLNGSAVRRRSCDR